MEYKYALAGYRQCLSDQLRIEQGNDAAEYEETTTNELAVQQIAAWLSRNSEHGIDPHKSLLVIGNTGSGKTLLLKAASRFITNVWGVASFGVVSCRSLARSFAVDGYSGDVDKWLDAPHICLDDLGAENPEQVRYGQRTNLMAEIIEHRYDRLMRGQKAWTHFTTNLGVSRLKEYYGSRVMSRLEHMCNVVPCGTSSDARDFRRTAKGVMRKEPAPKNENVYQSMSPEVAHRLLQVLGQRRGQEISIGGGFVPSLKTDVAALEQQAARYSKSDLIALRASFSRERYGTPYVEVLDKYIANAQD